MEYGAEKRKMLRRLLLSENTISALVVGTGWSAASLALLLYPFPTANNADVSMLFILEIAIFEAAGFGLTALEIQRRFKKLTWGQMLAVAGAAGGGATLLVALVLNQFFDNLFYLIYLFLHFMVIGGIGGLFVGLALRQSLRKAFDIWYIISNMLVWALAPIIFLYIALPISSILPYVFLTFHININSWLSGIIFSCLAYFFTGFICARIMFQLVAYAQQGQARQELEERERILEQHPEFISSVAPGETLHVIDSGEAVGEGVRRKLGL